MLLYTDPRFLEHVTGAHPERPERLSQITAHLRRTGLDAQCRVLPAVEISSERLSRVHDLDYAEALRQAALAGGGRIEEDTVISPASHNVALAAAGSACDAVARVLNGEDNRALCLVRPPGHHALRGDAMGFCLFNNIALAARVAIDEFALDRVLIVDWDVHHGNGTQDAFWTDEQVAFFSAHRWPFYPGSGRASETGGGAGLGTTLNLPFEFGVSRKNFLDRFALELERFATKMRPQLVLISAGFDAHRDDPVGSLGLETEDFAALTELVRDIADEHAGGKIVSVLEGGYNTGVLAGCVEVHLRGLLDGPS